MREIITLFGPNTTRWLLVENGVENGSFSSPHGRRFAPGDHVVLATPGRTTPHKGTSWQVAAVEDAPGWDGRLILDHAGELPDA
jgi:hypothetical protein